MGHRHYESVEQRDTIGETHLGRGSGRHPRRIQLFVCLASVLFSCGCVITTGPAVSKSAMGNLEVNISVPEGMNAQSARMYVDDVFVGNVSDRLPVLYLKRGKRRIRIELNGVQTYQETIDILGEPNHQVLNVMLQRK